MTEYRTVRLPEDLCATVERSITGQFESLEAMLGFLLQEIVRGDGTRFDQAEQEMLEQRLRDLGYM